ncbi:MAG: hypothetical protein K2L51_07880 [Clostridiales bacterium]|nr:hypothetical protein [Clostridiales bacterium]
MSAIAQFHCITTNYERTETFADGEVEFTPTAVYLSVEMPDYILRIGVSDDVTTITRIGKDDYTLVLKEGTETVMDLGFAQCSIYTKKLRFRKSDGKVDFMVKYNYGGDDELAVTMLVHGTYDERCV